MDGNVANVTKCCRLLQNFVNWCNVVKCFEIIQNVANSDSDSYKGLQYVV